MSQRKTPKKGKGEGEEGTDGAGKQGGGGDGKDNQPHQKKTGLAGAARYAKKRITAQPRSSSVAKEPNFSPPPPPSPPTVKQQGEAQPQPVLLWKPWQKSPDPQQPIASASVAVQPSVEQQPDDDETVTTTEGATPPVLLEYQHDNITMSAQEPLLPQETDDVELSLKLTRMELERDKYKRDIENKERQLKEYEEEIIALRTHLSKSRGGGGIQLPVDQLKQVAEYEATIKRLKDEKGELERGKEEELIRQKKLEEEREELARRKEELEQKMARKDKELEQEKELAKKNEELKEELEKEKEDLKKENEELTTMNEALVRDKGNLEEEKEELTIMKDALVRDKGNLEKEKEELTTMKDALVRDKEDLEAEKEELERQKEEEIKKLMDEVVRLKGEKEELKEEKEKLERQQKEEVAELKKEELTRKKEKLEMKGNAEVNEVHKEMEEHTKQLEKDKQQLEVELAGAKEELQSTKEKHKQEKGKYEDQLKELNEEMNKKIEEYHQQAETKIKHHKTEAIAKAEDKLDKENEALLNQVEELKNDIEMGKQQIKELEVKVKVQSEEAKRTDEAAQLEAQCEEHQEEVIKERVIEEIDQHNIRNTRKANNQLAIQQADQWKPWVQEKQQPERRGPIKAVHPSNQSQHEVAEKNGELENEKEELAKKKEELEREKKALQEAKDELEENKKLLRKKEKEVTDFKQDTSFTILKKRLKDKELEAIKQQLERELADAKEEVKLVKERFKMTKNEELKKQLNELEEERNDKLEQLQQKDIKIKQLEEQLSEKQKQLSEKEKNIFDMEASIATDQKVRERLNKEKEEKEKESDKNIADATQRIDELERQQQEQLQAINNLTEENERLRVGGSEREKLTRELNEKDAELKEQHIKVNKLEEEVERIRLEGERQAELENKFRREQEDSKQEIQRLINNVQEAARAKYSDRIKEWQAKLMEVEEENKKLEKLLSEKEAKKIFLSDELTTKDGENLKLKKQLHDQRQKNAILQKSLDEKSQTAIDLGKEVGKVLESSTEKEGRIKELVERLQLKETENALFKQDFESERNDRERIHTQLTDLQEKCKVLEEELVKNKREETAEAKMKFHDLQQSHSTAEHDLKESQKRIVELLKKEAESSATIQSLTEEKRKMDKQLKEMKAMETDRIECLEEEIQVLTAQVNAYSRECEKQKGLVAQNQERHKTEVQELNEKLTNEQKSKQQLVNELNKVKQNSASDQKLVNELAILRQQVDSLTASRESLLTSYKQEQAMVTSLQHQLQRMREESAMIKQESVRMKQSNKVLMEKVVASREEVASLRRILSEFQSSWEVSQYDVNLSRKELGRGGWGVVWIGQMRVAVKQIHQSIKSDTNLKLLRQEINTMSQIRHPNLVHFIGAVFDGDSPDMIITEVMDTSLRNAYETKKLTPDRPCRPVILSIMRDVAVGLSYLHCLPKPIIHRDVSSGNVLLQSIGRGRWRAKISDFGSAKLAQFAVTKGPGAPAYSAPEAFQSITNPDAIMKQTPKMDVFSYGVLLCEAITCRFPYRDAFQDMLRQVYRISDRPRGSRSTQGYLLHALILSSCNDDPSKRPTMNEVIKQLGIIAM